MDTKIRNIIVAILVVVGCVCLYFEVIVFACFFFIAALLFRFAKKRNDRKDYDDFTQNPWRWNNDNFNNNNSSSEN